MARVGELARGLAAGVAGTAAMTLSTAVQRRLTRQRDRPLDYDASDHVATAVGTVLDRPPQDDVERRAYFVLAHWGYGSAVALGYPVLLRLLGDDRRAAAGFWVGCEAMAMSLFPTIGGTPPPWRWRPGLTASSLVHHAVYVVTVAGMHRLTHGSGASRPPR